MAVDTKSKYIHNTNKRQDNGDISKDNCVCVCERERERDREKENKEKVSLMWLQEKANFIFKLIDVKEIIISQERYPG